MPELNTNNQVYNLGTGTPLYNYADSNSYQTPNGQTVNVTSPAASQQGVTSPIYQYPVSSIYAPNASSGVSTNAASSSCQAQKDQSSGVNIYIYNPSAIGGQSSSSSASAAYGYPAAQQQAASQPLASAPVSEKTSETTTPESPKKTKDVVALTDDYIKTLESYLRSDDKSVRKMGIQELIKRFEEDKTRYDDEALTALLNIALQDADDSNRLLAMSPIAASVAHGDENTVSLLQNLTKSDKLYGQEAKMAADALLKASQTKTSIPDDSPEKQEKEENSDTQ